MESPPPSSSRVKTAESVSEKSPKLYRQVATEQGSRVKLCVLLFALRVAGLQGMPVPQVKKFLVRRGIEPQSPAYMASALTTELLTAPAEMNALTFISYGTILF